MAAPQIPNLFSLRNSSPRGRGRGRPFGSANNGSGDDPEAARTKDRIVQQTDQDASVSRLSAVRAGYLDDPFAEEFVAPEIAQKRYPIINHGLRVRLERV